MLNLNCVICAELFVASDDVRATNCGHMFHIACLKQWMERLVNVRLQYTAITHFFPNTTDRSRAPSVELSVRIVIYSAYISTWQIWI